MGMYCEKKTMIGWRNVWSMKWRVTGQEVDQRKRGERLWKNTVEHVDWIGRMPWIVLDGESRYGWLMTTMSVSGWMFLLVPAHPGFPGQIPQSRKTVVCVCFTLEWRMIFTYLNRHYTWTVWMLGLGLYAVILCCVQCPSIRLSITSRHFPEMAKRRIIQTKSVHNSPGTHFFTLNIWCEWTLCSHCEVHFLFLDLQILLSQGSFTPDALRCHALSCIL